MSAKILLPPPMGAEPSIWAQWYSAFSRFVNDYLAGEPQVFTPVFTNLTTAGSVTTKGWYYRVGSIVKFYVTITTSGGGTSQSNAGVTTMNLPITAAFIDAGSVSDSTANIYIGGATLSSSTQKMYPPSWGPTSNTIVLTGLYTAA